MNNKKAKKLFDLLNTYPSPHNGQPIRLKQTAPNHFTVLFQKERGLQATDISYIFSYVSMGVFCAYAELCGKALGHKVSYVQLLPPESELHGSGDIIFANISIEWDSTVPDKKLFEAIGFRQTSRKKYYQGIDATTSKQVARIAKDSGMVIHKLDKSRADQSIWLNQRAVFDDMFDNAVKNELNHWLRYSKKEKELKRDGLAYDSMQLNGRAMKFIVNHPQVLHLPGLSVTLEKYYLRTMVDNSDVFYMLAPFRTEAQSFAVGEIISKIWMALSLQGYYLHPFGTIMSNHRAHQDFLKMVGITHESRERSYLVFIFRAGKSDQPVRSLRIPYDKHLIME